MPVYRCYDCFTDANCMIAVQMHGWCTDAMIAVRILWLHDNEPAFLLGLKSQTRKRTICWQHSRRMNATRSDWSTRCSSSCARCPTVTYSRAERTRQKATGRHAAQAAARAVQRSHAAGLNERNKEWLVGQFPKQLRALSNGTVTVPTVLNMMTSSWMHYLWRHHVVHAPRRAGIGLLYIRLEKMWKVNGILEGRRLPVSRVRHVTFWRVNTH